MNTTPNILDINPQSFWLASTEKTDYPVLQEDIEVDIAIVGGGMVGITTAYLLKKEGIKVAIIEADGILQGTTGHTTAKITSQHGLIYDQIKSKLGQEKAQIYADSNESAIRFIKSLVTEKQIECDLEDRSAFVYTQSDEYIQKIMDEAKTAESLGIKAEFVEEIDLPFSIIGAVRFDNQAQFHPRKYLLKLAKEVPGGGCHIFERTRAVDIEGKEHPVVMIEKGHKIKAAKVLVASHYPFYDKPGLYFARISPERSYVLGVTIKEKFPKGMYITAEDPGRSLRSQKYKDGELILVGGEHHKTGHGKSTIIHYENLRDFAIDTFTVEEFLYRWATHDCKTMDDIPYIGKLSPTTPNVYLATGFRKWGMTNSTVSAMIIRDLMVKGDNPWLSLYDPLRINLSASASNFIKENTDVAVSFVTGKLSRGLLEESVQPNEGKIINLDGKKVGAYRDGAGELHLVTVTCTHMGCGLSWNDAETTWDCPCHGSRFSIDGDIVEGPTTKGLQRINPSEFN